MVVLLKKLTYAALLSPSEASEEFREGVIMCFKALIWGLNPCSSSFCSCQQHPGLPMLGEYGDLQVSEVRAVNHSSEQGECLLSFLQSPAASAAVGHWLSLLLKAADTEAERGHRGSANLRIEAFVTLRVLVAKVGSADALAFFLPGVVSQFAKVLHVMKTIISGAAGNVEATGQAIRGLAEYLMIVLYDDANISSLDVHMDASFGYSSGTLKSTALLDELRSLPLKSQSQGKGDIVSISDKTSVVVDSKYDTSGRGTILGKDNSSFIVHRSKEWIEKTSVHVNKLLSATFPLICVHPSKTVREGLLAAIRGIILHCSHTLKLSRVMLLECVCVLVLDDCKNISSTAQEFMEHLLSSTRSRSVKHDIAEIFCRLIEKLPKTLLGSNESVALSHSQKLLAVIYYSGPQFLIDHLQSPVAAARLFDILFLCFGQNLAFSGSLGKLISAKPSSAGYLQSIAEFKSSHFSIDSLSLSCSSHGSKSAMSREISANLININARRHYELPRMPPWFAYAGSLKLYEAVASVLRLLGLSLITGTKNQGHLSVIVDIPLSYLHKLISEVRLEQCKHQGWHYWYSQTGSGQLLRQASTAACVLNEIIYGISEKSLDAFRRSFLKLESNNEKFYPPSNEDSAGNEPYETEHGEVQKFKWTVSSNSNVRNHLIECVGRILHEYLSSEVWEIPLDRESTIIQPDSDTGDKGSHLFREAAMLRRVIIEGIGIFSICLGTDFTSCGFLHSSLYLLLENLTCSNFEVRCAADNVLHIIAAASGYLTAGQLVMENADYLVDSIVQQFRNLDANPHVPNVIASLLSFIGMGQKVLPLLEEPICSMSQELEIISRHKHPKLTLPILKAVMEIAKASKREACLLPTEAESFSKLVMVKICETERKFQQEFGRPISFDGSDANLNDQMADKGEWENILFKLSDTKRYRRIVGSVAALCLTAATPLIASLDQAASLVALDIVEDAIAAIAKVEEAYRHEKGTKEAIEDMLSSCSAHGLKDLLDAAEDDSSENRLLPAMNKLWPFLIACVRNNNMVAVRKCLGVVSSTVQICGGNFFSRRFHTDGGHIWKLLSDAASRKRNYNDERIMLQLPYRNTAIAPIDSVAEASNLKIQVAVLDMIAELSRNGRSASALELVLKKVSGLVVGVACSGTVGLRGAAMNALSGLASIDADLIWLLLADVYFSLKRKDLPSPSAPHFLPVEQTFPPPLSQKGFLYVQYGGQSYGFDIDLASVETVLKQLQ